MIKANHKKQGPVDSGTSGGLASTFVENHVPIDQSGRRENGNTSYTADGPYPYKKKLKPAAYEPALRALQVELLNDWK